MIDVQPHDWGSERASLNRLAAALGCSPEVFSNPPPSELGQTVELLSLWLAVKDVQDRAKVLLLLRKMSGRAEALSEIIGQASGEPVALTSALQKPE